MNDAMRKKALEAFLNYLGIPANQVQHFAKLEDEYLHWPIWERAWQVATENALEDNAARRELTALQSVQGRDVGWQLAMKLESALDLILPMAKGYAAANRVGNNALYIESATEILKEAQEAFANTQEGG